MGHCLQEEIQAGYRGIFGIKRPVRPGRNRSNWPRIVKNKSRPSALIHDGQAR